MELKDQGLSMRRTSTARLGLRGASEDPGLGSDHPRLCWTGCKGRSYKG